MGGMGQKQSFPGGVRGGHVAAFPLQALPRPLPQTGGGQSPQSPASSPLHRPTTDDKGRAMIQPPETVRVTKSRVACDGASDIPAGAALGHPRIYLEIDEKGYAECGYCDRRFVLIGGPADISEEKGAQAA